MAQVKSTITCIYCGKTVTRSNRGQVTCGGKECMKRRKAECKRKWRAAPKQVAKRREIDAQWRASDRDRRQEQNQKTNGRNPWLLGAPPYEKHLPGGACLLTIPRFRKVPVDKLAQLHGMVSALIAECHPANAVSDNGFALLPWDGGIGWVVYSPHPALAGPRTRQARLGGHRMQVCLGPYARLKAPSMGKRGKIRVQVATITPVVITTMQRTRACRTPTADNIVSTLRCTMAPRLGLDVLPAEDIPLQFVDALTEPAEWFVGGKWGQLKGWAGTLTIETNAVGAWLLECAGRGLGLGGRTALGCGRVKVEVLG